MFEADGGSDTDATRTDLPPRKPRFSARAMLSGLAWAGPAESQVSHEGRVGDHRKGCLSATAIWRVLKRESHFGIIRLFRERTCLG